MNFTISAYSLLSKFGFEDGDIFLEITDNRFDSHKLLVTVVNETLLPVLPDWVKVEEICTIHNPIRIVDEQWDRFNDDESSLMTVIVGDGQLRDIASRHDIQLDEKS